MATKKTAARKSQSKAKEAKAVFSLPPLDKPMGKNEMIKTLSQWVKVTQAQTEQLLDGLGVLMKTHLEGPGVFTFPEMFRLVTGTLAASPARKLINPRTQKEILVPAKPARKTVRMKSLKKLKEIV